MAVKTFKLSNKNQTTIPKSSRKLLNLKPHDKIEFINNYKTHTVTIKKASNLHHNIFEFDNPEFNRRNYLKFCKENRMSTDQNPMGKESWKY